MEWIKYVILIILSIVLLGFAYKIIAKYIWNQRLQNFRINHNVDTTFPPQYKSVIWTKLVSLVLVFSLTTLLLFSFDNEGLSAKTFSSLSELEEFVQRDTTYYSKNYNFSFLPSYKLDGYSIRPDENSSYNSNQDKYLGTNNQVEGVLEADIIKTNGKYIYYVYGATASYYGEIKVFEVLENKNLLLKTSLSFYKERILDLFLTDDYLIIITNDYNETYVTSTLANRTKYNSVIRVLDYETLNLVYQLNSTTWADFYRIIDNKLYVIGTFNTEHGNSVPKIDTIHNDLTNNYFLDPSKVIYFNDMSSLYMTVFISINLDSFLEDVFAIIGENDLIFMNKEAIIVTQIKPNITGEDIRSPNAILETRIIKFKFDINNKIKYQSYFDVKGFVWNQVSLDLLSFVVENQSWIDLKGDHLRIVSTDPFKKKNYLYILKDKPNTDLMDVVGSLSDELGKEDEFIKFVNFNDNEVKIVMNYYNTLYTINLSNPSKPKLINEIEENEYNSFAYSWNDEGQNISIGNLVDETGKVTGLKISAYQRIDDDQPLETVEITGFAWNKLQDHRSLLVSSDRSNVPYKFIGFSMLGESTFYLLMIDFTKDEIIAEPIKISHVDYDSADQIDRAVYINGYIYTFSIYGASSFNIEEKVETQTIYFNE